jgi:hypothetical protein
MEGAMLSLQEDLARLVSNARHMIASQSGHDIHQDRAEMMIAAIRGVVEAVHDPDTWEHHTSPCRKGSTPIAITIPCGDQE